VTRILRLPEGDREINNCDDCEFCGIPTTPGLIRWCYGFDTKAKGIMVKNCLEIPGWCPLPKKEDHNG
jgi:hypothetical protein